MGLATQVVRRKKAIAERFDGSVTEAQWVSEVKANMTLEGYVLDDMLFSEWSLPVTHDVILGKPWFSHFNPSIDWRTHEVTLDPNLLDPYWLIEDAERFFKLAEGADSTACCPWQDKKEGDNDDWSDGVQAPRSLDDDAVDEEEPWLSGAIARLLQDYADCFPKELPNELPVSRAVQFALVMKPDAHPSPRAPFRLSKTEQEALKLFVEELLRKQWTETSDSPWVSSIFAVPKKDPTTGKAPSKAEWVRSGNASLPVREFADRST